MSNLNLAPFPVGHHESVPSSSWALPRGGALLPGNRPTNNPPTTTITDDRGDILQLPAPVPRGSFPDYWDASPGPQEAWCLPPVFGDGNEATSPMMPGWSAGDASSSSRATDTFAQQSYESELGTVNPAVLLRQATSTPATVNGHLSVSRSVPRNTTCSDRATWLRSVFDSQRFVVTEWRRDDQPERFGISTSASRYAPHHQFGGLPFSSAIGANHHPQEVQEMQRKSLFSVSWEALPLSITNEPDDPMANILDQLQTEIRRGVNLNDLCGDHAFIGALHDQDVFDRAPLLSQMMARLAKSVKPHENFTSATMYALMYSHWCLFRWLLSPNPRTFADLPNIVRPLPRQLFAKHLVVVDFVHSPTLRDFLCHFDKPQMQWMSSACDTIELEWGREATDAICRDGLTGELDLNPIFKSFVGTAGNWTTGREVRQFLPNTDRFWRVREY